MKDTDVIIIGAGAAGLSCALYLARAGVKFLLLEKGAPGGKLLTIDKIGNYPGFAEVSGLSLAQALVDSATRVGVEVSYGLVQSVRADPAGGFIVECEDERYHCRAVVVASGLANVPTIPGEKMLFGRGVSYCATCDGPLYKNKDALLYGSGERALEEALYLAPLLHELVYVSPEAELQGSPALIHTLQQQANVRFFFQSKLTAIEGETHVERARITTPQGEEVIPLSAVFPLLGEKSASAFLSPLPLTMARGFIVVDERMMASYSGVFAIGDIVDKKLRQVVTACGDGANASSAVIGFLRQGETVHG